VKKKAILRDTGFFPGFLSQWRLKVMALLARRLGKTSTNNSKNSLQVGKAAYIQVPDLFVEACGNNTPVSRRYCMRCQQTASARSFLCRGILIIERGLRSARAFLQRGFQQCRRTTRERLMLCQNEVSTITLSERQYFPPPHGRTREFDHGRCNLLHRDCRVRTVCKRNQFAH